MCSLTLIIAAGLSAAGPDAVPFYADKLDLTCYLEPSGERRPIASAADWAIRRAHVRAGFQQVAGPLPSRERLEPLDLQVESEEDFPKFVRKKKTQICAETHGQRHGPEKNHPLHFVSDWRVLS